MTEVKSTSSTNDDQTPRSPEIKGVSALPIQRVKRIIREDADVAACATEATFLISIAAELFISRMAQAGFDYAHRDKRKMVMYKDVALSVAEVEQFEFLGDIVPKTMSLEKALERASSMQKDTNSLPEEEDEASREE
ncbi:MAG: histone-fold-containing protein [Piptocephalis tieghemiana]|nr:MAG: histone-fold-containing protein [Piptocephalis tieghemiana]